METTTKTTKTTTTAGGTAGQKAEVGEKVRSLGDKIKEVATDLKDTFVNSLPDSSSFDDDPTGSKRRHALKEEKKTEVRDPITGAKTKTFEKTEKTIE